MYSCSTCEVQHLFLQKIGAGFAENLLRRSFSGDEPLTMNNKLLSMNYKPIRVTSDERPATKIVCRLCQSVPNKSVSIRVYFTQNKPNFLINRPFVSTCKSKGYENEHRFLAQKSQTQFQKRQNEHKYLFCNDL